MSSYHGENTAKIQEQMRRDAKKKQSKGTGLGNQNVQKVDFKEAAQNVPRFFQARFAPKTLGLFTNIMEAGRLVSIRDIDTAFQAGQINVILEGHSAKIMGMEEQELTVGRSGFIGLDGKEPRAAVWGLAVALGAGYGVNFNWNNKRRVMVID